MQPIAHRRTPGISRIDQPEKRTRGFFVRLSREGRIYNAFFADKTHGGKRRALQAAQQHYQKLLREHRPISRRRRAQTLRRRGASGIIGVQEIIISRPGYRQKFWRAVWSPRRYLVRSRMFSTRKYGARKAKALAIRARKEGLRNMAD